MSAIRGAAYVRIINAEPRKVTVQMSMVQASGSEGRFSIANERSQE